MLCYLDYKHISWEHEGAKEDWINEYLCPYRADDSYYYTVDEGWRAYGQCLPCEVNEWVYEPCDETRAIDYRDEDDKNPVYLNDLLLSCIRLKRCYYKKRVKKWYPLKGTSYEYLWQASITYRNKNTYKKAFDFLGGRTRLR